jgi:hypothetical protein
MQLIKQWLEGKQNFIVGRILYNQYGNDPKLKALFAKGEKATGAKEALLQALQALLQVPVLAADTQAAQEPVIIQPAAAPEPGKAVPKSEDPIFPKDPVEKALQLEWKSKYKAMQYLRLQLERYGKDNSLEVQARCKELCQEILALEQNIMSIWKKVDQYRATGKLEEVKETPLEVPADPLELAKKINAVQRYIRRHKTNTINNPDNAKYPALVAKYEEQLKALTTPKQTQNGAAEKATI